MPKGVIIKGIGGFYYVKCNNDVYECKARGKFRKKEIVPMVGDHVNIKIYDEENKKGSIEVIFDRKMFLLRPPVSNIDQAVIVIAALSPEPDFYLLDKLILHCEIQNIDIVICINKIDLDIECNFKHIEDIYRKVGYKVICTSSKTLEGIVELKKLLNNRISVFAGVSGVGKSTILNTIDNRLTLQTGEISKKISRGRHTTRHLEFLELESGGFVVDTPGFSSLENPEVEKDHLSEYFREFRGYMKYCRFAHCSHTNEPQCRVIEELKSGNISKSRYDSYVQIYDIIKSKKEWEK
jgi:ribosome biogenesis GTPase